MTENCVQCIYFKKLQQHVCIILGTDQPKKKALFLRSLREQKFSNANFCGENSKLA